MPETRSLPPRTALVTGASRGIGRSIALRLGEMGYAVAINYRAGKSQAEEVVGTIVRDGGTAVALQADVGVPSEASGLVRRACAELGSLGILVNNAGITRDRLLLQLTDHDWDATWTTNLTGARAAARAALEIMCSQRAGRILNVSSVVGVSGNAGQSNYAAAKAAVLGLTTALAVDAAPSNVTVNCIVPGYIVTDATAHLTEQQRRTWLERIPMARDGTLDEVTELSVFLLGAGAGYITGQCIAVDGGLLAVASLGGR